MSSLIEANVSRAARLSSARRVQQIAVADIAQFTALVIERRLSFLGKRIDIASDELTLVTAAEAISEASGRHIEYTALPVDPVRQLPRLASRIGQPSPSRRRLNTPDDQSEMWY